MKYLQQYGVVIVREGSAHTIVERINYISEVPRHKEINNKLARKICSDLKIPFKW